MYSSAADLAKAALRLLEMNSEDSGEGAGEMDRVMAAAMLATHVCDWHYMGVHGRTPSRADKQDFGSCYPDWDTLRKVANGTKHPTMTRPQDALRKADLSTGHMRQAEWEDYDFWHSPFGRDTLFIEVDGQVRGLHAVVLGFCQEYLRLQDGRRGGGSST